MSSKMIFKKNERLGFLKKSGVSVAFLLSCSGLASPPLKLLKPLCCGSQSVQVHVGSPTDLSRIDRILDHQGHTLLTQAISEGNVKRVRQLLQEGADPNVKTASGITPLELSLDKQERGFTRVLDFFGRKRPLFGSPLAQLLIEAGANPNFILQSTGETPLTTAIDQGRVSEVDFLIQQGADVNLENQNRRSPLHEALRLRREDMVRSLLAQGVGIQSCLEELLDRGEELQFREALRWTQPGRALIQNLLLRAVQRDLLPLARVLVDEFGAKIQGETPGHESWLFDSVTRRDQRMLNHWIALGADINERNSEGISLIHHAYREDNLDAMSELLHQRADVTSLLHSGEFKLSHLAWFSSDVAFVKKWIDLGADIHDLNSDQNYDLLFWAIFRRIGSPDPAWHQLLVELLESYLSEFEDPDQKEEFIRNLTRYRYQGTRLVYRRGFDEWVNQAVVDAKNKMRTLDYIWKEAPAIEAALRETHGKDHLPQGEHGENCLICFDHHRIEQGQGPAGCDCSVCSICAQDLIIKGRGNGGSSQLIRCPGCGYAVSLAFIKKQGFTPAQTQNFIKKQFDEVRAKVYPNWKNCLGPDCVAGKRVDGKFDLQYQCELCSFKGCLGCGTHHDPEKTCDQIRMHQDRETVEWIEFLVEQGKLAPPRVYPDCPGDRKGETKDKSDPYYFGRYRRCPRCSYLTERMDGCNAMNCPKCDKPWHWNYGTRGVGLHDSRKEPQQF